MDRGRLLLGLMLVVPVAALVPTGGRLTATDASSKTGGPNWTATDQPNPIKAITDPKDVVAALTNRTVDGIKVVTGDQTRQETLDAAQAASDAGEVGSDTASPNAPANGPTKASTPSPSKAPGPVPVAQPAITNYPAPPGATFVFPLAGAASFTNDWGGARPGGRVHRGIDLFAKAATPVLAEVDGTVFNVGWNDAGGWRYWIRDQWGNEYYHAHLSAFAPAAKEGARVTAGTVLGFVGNTGDAKSTPPHLHLEIHPVGGDAIPPFDYVSGWQRVG